MIERDEKRVCATVSIGIAGYPTHADEVEELINLADQALYIAKENGRKQVALPD